MVLFFLFFMMILVLSLQFLTFIVISVLGIFIYTKNPRSSTNRAFAMFAVLGVAGWIISLFLTIVGFVSSLFWGRIAWTFASFMAADLLWFVHIFPEPTKHAKAWRNIALFFGVIFAVVGGSPYMVTSVAVVNGYITGNINPIPYLAWDAFFLFSLLYAMIRSWIRTIRSKGLVHNQLMAVTIGITAFLLPFLLTNIILPLVANDFRWNNLGPIFTIFLIGFVAHAIITYRFLEIRWVIKKSFDFIFLWGFVFLAIFGFQLFLDKTFQVTTIQVATSFVIAMLIGPVSRFIERTSAKFTSRGSYIFEDAVSDVTDMIHTTLELTELQKILAEKLATYFGFTRIAIVAFSPNNPEQALRTFVRGYKKDIIKVIPSSAKICAVNNHEIIESSELKWRLSNSVAPQRATADREDLKFMQSWGVSVMMPFCVGEEMIGIALFGERRDSSVLTDRDLALLHVIQGAAAPAMANGVRFEEVKRLYTRLSDLDKAKSDFIGVVSHQFRTPLTAIMWNAELALEQKVDPKKVTDALEQIRSRAQFLNVTLSRTFDVLALENKQLKLENKLVDFRTVVADALKEVEEGCKLKKLKVETNLHPAMVNGDREKLASIAHTLIENACGFSKARGKISVDLILDEEQKKVTLKVADNGIGIPEENIPHIFDKFYRGENATKNTADGAGISLYLAKNFAEKQRGKIDVSSELGKGTVFTVTFPLAEF